MGDRSRKVYLPLEKFETCHACSTTSGAASLKLCSACGERSYCSTDCQKKDWTSHKAICGKTDRIDVEKYYPFLAYMVETSHCQQAKPPHPGMTHAIINSPNPGSNPTGLPDGSAANLVMLGDPIALFETGSEKWWPSAMTPKVRSKFLRRIVREGYTLPVVTSICLALLAEMYTTTWISAADSQNGRPERRARLTYKSSPIADFGIAAGSVNVKNQDKLAYLSLSDMSFMPGQDPDDHYWIYFTTIRGEDILLDCSMFTFNFCCLISCAPYHCNDLPTIDYAPAFFLERNIRQHAPDLHTERTRMSVLRSDIMHRAIAYPLEPLDVALTQQFMEKLAGRPMSKAELNFTEACYNTDYCAIAINLDTREWNKWPAQPDIGFEADPGQVVDDHERNDAWVEFLKKWNKKHNKGTADPQALGIAFEKWRGKRAKHND